MLYAETKWKYTLNQNVFYLNDLFKFALRFSNQDFSDELKWKYSFGFRSNISSSASQIVFDMKFMTLLNPLATNNQLNNFRKSKQKTLYINLVTPSAYRFENKSLERTITKLRDKYHEIHYSYKEDEEVRVKLILRF